jgi:phosphopantothenoylcysteine decarboxylase/phosphopantothenate--cysteine ligase
MKKAKKRLNILIAAGATREAIDPVRFISNYATGYFGHQIAEAAKKRGHKVILITGPTVFAKPRDIRSINVETSGQMKERLKEQFRWCDCLIMNAAVCDFRPVKVAKKKIKKGTKEKLCLPLRQNPDILKILGRKKGKKMLVGFALETEGLEKNAQAKLKEKNLDLIVATPMNAESYPFGRVKLNSVIIEKSGRKQRVKEVTKARLSRILLDNIERTMLN